jgi:hypothetical protein
MSRGLINGPAVGVLTATDINSVVVTVYPDAAKINGTQSTLAAGSEVKVFGTGALKIGQQVTQTASGRVPSSTVKKATVLGIRNVGTELFVQLGNFVDENGDTLASITFTGNQFLVPTTTPLPSLFTTSGGSTEVANPFTIDAGHASGLDGDNFYVENGNGETYFVDFSATATSVNDVTPVPVLAAAWPTVPSAASIILPEGQRDIYISGTADITYIYPNRTMMEGSVRLHFTGTKGTNGVVDGLNLKLTATFAYTPDDVLEISSDGVNVYEVGRNLN